ncbi:MAG TPA: hypothetical protein ENJ00_04915 [Phycisphaerales bacterium]|nr:hypothetical protein [Phycisphaerales bacterium]
MWNPFRGRRFADRARLARRTHELWLDRALRTGRPHPRIPKREVRLGGFDELMKTAGGRMWADAWWKSAFDSVESD